MTGSCNKSLTDPQTASGNHLLGLGCRALALGLVSSLNEYTRGSRLQTSGLTTAGLGPRVARHVRWTEPGPLAQVLWSARLQHTAVCGCAWDPMAHEALSCSIQVLSRKNWLPSGPGDRTWAGLKDSFLGTCKQTGLTTL